MSGNIMQTQINQILDIVQSHKERFDKIENRLDVIEEGANENCEILSEQIRQLDKQHGERMAKLEVITLEYDNRMDRIDKRMDRLADSVDRLADKVDRLIDRVDSMYKWIIGLILGLLSPMWASIIIAILVRK